LDWTQTDLAREAGIAPSVVNLYERGRSEPHLETLGAIAGAFNRAGIVFLNGDAPGVQLQPPQATAGNGEGPAQGKSRPGRRGGSRTAEAFVAA
jgi:transcriptional regulator with XRE-family HTH domain